MKVKYKLQAISKLLSTAGIEFTDKEAEIILRNALNMNVIDIYRDDPELTDKQMSLLESVVSRRTSREPLQYILGHVDFLGLKLQVGKGVLIPRPETELMAEYAIKAVSGQRSAVSSQENSKLKTQNSKLNSSQRILDLCTGSGCLALSLAQEYPDAHVYGSDISEIVLRYARRNADLNGINNVTFLQGNLFEPFTKLLTLNSKLFSFDLIISNPPYIKSDDIRNLQPEIKDWEPLNALDGGTDGLDFYRAIIPIARQFLKDSGILMLEIGISQADTVAQMFECSGYKDIVVQKDYAGIERIISAHNLV
ncbi:MAG: peptide chain release factor N(5)-glutamine methyltransferase [Nitrospirae bacterium]|nr:peptide chain release factor N(5)-glutamine methyltransferase [Nitrospirota bacterium]